MKKINIIFYILLPILILGIPLRFTSFPLSLAVLILLTLLTNRHSAGIFLLMYGGPLGGITRSIYPILPVYGLLLEFIGIVLLWDVISDLFKKHWGTIAGMIGVLAFFGFFYLLGTRDQFSTQKYFDVCTHGIMMLFGYYAFERSSKIDIEGLTRILIVAAVCMFAYCILAARMTPGGLWDLNWFRDQSRYFNHLNENNGTLVGYQHIGMLCLFATAIYLSQKRLKAGNTFFYVACASYLALVSGCRQAMLGVALVIALRAIVFKVENINANNMVARMVWMVAAMIGAYFLFLFFFENLQSDVVAQTLDEGDEARSLFFISAIDIFNQNPVTGAGLGGFHAITGSVYPHNMFFELLCETGLVGVIGSILFLFIPLMRKKQGLLHITESNQFYFLIVVGIFVRVMVSSDLRESIELFCAVFAVTSVNYYLGRPVRRTVEIN